MPCHAMMERARVGSKQHAWTPVQAWFPLISCPLPPPHTHNHINTTVLYICCKHYARCTCLPARRAAAGASIIASGGDCQLTQAAAPVYGQATVSCNNPSVAVAYTQPRWEPCSMPPPRSQRVSACAATGAALSAEHCCFSMPAAELKSFGVPPAASVLHAGTSLRSSPRCSSLAQ